MPKHSNDFQKLIYLIRLQLEDNATVTESKFLHDNAANVEREVNIVIEAQVDEYSIIISIECHGRGRVANAKWVEQMAVKHETLPIDKLILISKSGFSDIALRKAKAQGIQAMTLTQAIQADWDMLIERIYQLKNPLSRELKHIWENG
jgi:hypothetical protein